MKCIADFNQHIDETLMGEYRIIEASRATARRSGKQGWRMRVSDYSGTCEICHVPESMTSIPFLGAGQVIRASLTPRLLADNQIKGAAQSLQTLSIHDVENAARLMPFDKCPHIARPALEDLIIMIDELQNPAVRRCMNHLVDQYHEGWLLAQGSWNHHHNYEGGLLVHTVSTMKVARQSALHVYPHDRWRVDVIVLGALMHDLGKLHSHRRGTRSKMDRVLRHEWLTLGLAREALETLESQCSYAADQIAEILKWFCESPENREKGPNKDAEIIHWADALDVKRDRQLDPATQRPRFKPFEQIRNEDIM